jgi:hypothetical protein
VTVYGLPVQSWLLILMSVGLGLAIVLKFYFNGRRDKDRKGTVEPR